jgi:hypothetical protein
MFREMRRKKQSLSKDTAIEILKASTSGVLAVSGDNDYPYTVPLSHVYQDGKLYFHCAREGHKIDGIQRNNKVSFCVIDQDEVIQESFATLYRSVTVFGRARILTEDSERRSALECLVQKFSPDYIEQGQREIERDWDRVCVLEVSIEHITGKVAQDLVTRSEG